MSLEQLRETSLIVGNLDRSRVFYQRVFGLPKILEKIGVIGLQLSGDAVLLLFDRATLPEDCQAGDTHLRFGVHPDALLEWDRHLTVNGVVIESRVESREGLSSLFFRDPDHYSLEVSADPDPEAD